MDLLNKKIKILQRIYIRTHFFFFFLSFSEQLWLLNGLVEDSTAGDYFFYPLTGTEHGSQPCLTTCDRELVSVLEVRIEPGDLNPRPLTPQSVTLPTLPRAGWVNNHRITFSLNWRMIIYKELQKLTIFIWFSWRINSAFLDII